jgi:hypothetical protein
MLAVSLIQGFARHDQPYRMIVPALSIAVFGWGLSGDFEPANFGSV